MYKKKILIGIIIILSVIVLANVTMLFLRKKEFSKTNSLSKIETAEKKSDTPEILESEIEQNKSNELIENTNVTNAEITPVESFVPRVEKTEAKNVEKSQKANPTKQVIAMDTSTNEDAQENIPQSNVENTPVQQEQNNVQNVTKEEPKSTNIPVEKPQENISVVETKEEFRVNNSLISKIQSIINSNPSSMMQEYGYNIVVDSSITDKTTGFSFTETRVKNAISYSMGTIRIYARDYYKNGNLMWSECFIL